MQVDFYHLTVTPLGRALPQIAEKIVGSGARLLIVSADETQRAALDKLLWTYAPDSFLAHAQTGEADDTAQPVLIAPDVVAGNGARNVAIVDGTWRDAALAFDRAFHFFEDEAIEDARLAWRALRQHDGIVRNYWKQTEAGRWEKPGE